MSCFPEIIVCRVGWQDAITELRAVRTAVFIDEQNVPAELEWDSMDEACLHVLAVNAGGVAVGTGRLLPDAHIGRMAVLAPWRGSGIGRLMLEELITAAREHRHPAVELSAQTHAIGFYRRFGFEIVSDEYLYAGIPHRTMRLSLFTPARR